jgi:peptide/nickel transport system ATP-binding protein
MAPADPRLGRHAVTPYAGKLLEVKDLTIHFNTPRGVLRAVEGVSVSLPRGKMLGIVGESGSGKSVFVRSLTGLIPKGAIAHSSGEVIFEGRDLRKMSEKAMRADIRGRAVAMIFQDPMTALNPVMKIGRQITESLRVHYDMTRRGARAAALDLLDQVGIPSPGRRFDEYPNQLSGGMRQRVVIAIALSCEPRLLIADEPTTALDVTVQAQILDLLKKLQEEQHMGIILITHDLNLVAGRADDIAVMYAGRVVESGPAGTIFRKPRMPYTAALLSAAPKLEMSSHTRLQVIAGRPPDLVKPPGGCKFQPRCERSGLLCVTDEPPLALADDPNHAWRCWYPVGGPPGSSDNGAGLSGVHVETAPDANLGTEEVGA